jgi:hypothetical protein
VTLACSVALGCPLFREVTVIGLLAQDVASLILALSPELQTQTLVSLSQPT